MEKIDLVFPYVDGNEPVWQEAYKETRRKLDLPVESISKVRFRQWDNLRYLFRSVEKFTPWIGNIYMIVSNKEQVPDWINTDEVKIVLHEDIIPEEYLPTFNSSVIEMFIGNIKGLSERFIYANDDLFFLKPLKEEDFFINAVPKLSVKKDKGLETMFKKMEWKGLKMIGDYFEKKLPDPEEEFLKIPHTFIPMCRETLRVVNKIFQPEIISSTINSPFRKAKNLQQYIYTYYQLFSGAYLDSERTYKYTAFKPNEYAIDKARTIASIITEQKYDSICINDCVEFKSDVVFETVKNIINSALEQILPETSKYELKVDNIYEKKYNIFKWLNKIVAEFNFNSEEEIKMFIDGVVDTIEHIKKVSTGEGTIDNSNDNS
jgi:hypothetical protein